MDPLESKVKAYISRSGLPESPAKLVVALSGGADSVALLAVMTSLGYDVTAAHCNFHLRGAESNRDMRHAEAVTERLAVDLCVKDFDVEARRKATGESLEMACRELRYHWFGELLDRLGAKAVAVGHHREDSVETFFINLLRGSGLSGLTGMKARRDHVIRPMLDCSRSEIEDYLRRRGLGWVDDSSNASDDFLRNRIRHEILPALERVSEGAVSSVLRSLEFLSEDRDFYTRALRRSIDSFRTDGNGIDLTALALDPDARLILFETLRGEGFSRQQTDDMLEAAGRHGGLFVSGDIKREVDHGILRNARTADAAGGGDCDVSLLRDILHPITIEISRHDVAEFKPEGNPRVIYIDERALQGSPRWQLRPWRRGDRLDPYGLDGSKLVSDIFASARLSAREKESTWLLWRDDCPLWVVGLRASRHWTVGPGTKRYLRLEFKPL